MYVTDTVKGYTEKNIFIAECTEIVYMYATIARCCVLPQATTMPVPCCC